MLGGLQGVIKGMIGTYHGQPPCTVLGNAISQLLYLQGEQDK